VEQGVVIQGRTDAWFTVEEFGAMVGRSPKTVLNWAAEGKIQLADLCGVKLVSMAMIENLITGHVPDGARNGDLALELMGRMTPEGTRVQPERRNRPKAVASHGASRLSDHDLPEKQQP
jgi:hypothetical protein